MYNISVYSCLQAKLHTRLDRSTIPGHLNCVPHPVCPSPPMSLVPLTLFAPPLPCIWCPSPCLPLPCHVFGFPHPVCPSPPMSLVSLTLFAPPLTYLWCSSPCLPLPSHIFGAPYSVCPSPPISLVFLTLFASPIPFLWCTPDFVCPPSSTYLNPPIYIVWSFCLRFSTILLIIRITYPFPTSKSTIALTCTVEPLGTDTSLIWTPLYYTQFPMSRQNSHILSLKKPP